MVNPNTKASVNPPTQSAAQKEKTNLKAKMHKVITQSANTASKPPGAPVVKKLNVI